MKYTALTYMGRYSEALECAKEWYCMYPTNHTHPPAIIASFAVIESCGFNNEYYDACLYARTLWETITMSRDSHIPDHQREHYTAQGAYELARALWKLAQHGDMPEAEQQTTGVEATMLARRALEIRIRLYEAESEEVASAILTLASILSFFNKVDDEETLHLYEQAKAIYIRVHGGLSVNVAACEMNLGIAYHGRARTAYAARDLDRCVAHFELTLPRYREAARIYRAINHVDMADEATRKAAGVEEWLRLATQSREQQ